jgi:replicative DNA helicase
LSSVSIVSNEKQTISTLLSIPGFMESLDTNYFTSAIARDIFDTLAHLYSSGISFTDEHIVSEGNQRNAAIDKSLVLSLREEPHDPDAFESMYIKRLKTDFAKYKIEQHLLKDTLVETTKKGALDVEKIERLLDAMQDNLDLLKGKESLLKSAETLFEKYQSVLIKRSKGELNFPTGDHHLDKSLLVGGAPGQMTSIFGATGTGKSAYSLNLANRKINKFIPHILVNLEMDEIATMDRLAAMRCRIPTKSFYPDENGEMPGYVFDLVAEEAEKLKKCNHFFLVDQANLDFQDLESIIKDGKRKMKTDYLQITVDLLTMVKEFSGEDAAGYEEGMNKWHRIIKQQRIHGINIIQSNRTADSAKVFDISQINKLRPTLNTIKNSNAIAERSRIVLSVFRPYYYAARLFPESEEIKLMDDVLEVAVLKQSQGVVGNLVKYFYDGDTFNCIPIIDSENSKSETISL